MKYYIHAGFTLIELSIVLVIIGLIVGGVLVSQDLVRAAAVRAQVTQIEKFNAAVNTFRGKYGYLPGDIKDPDASNFGFQARGQYAGEGDANGLIEGNYFNINGGNSSAGASNGETVVLWADLAKANLIEGAFTAATNSTVTGNVTGGTAIQQYLPQGKLGTNFFVYAYAFNGANYWNVLSINVLGAGLNSYASMSVLQAYSIDKKVDDGLPQSGNVLAQYVTGGQAVYWAGTASSTWPPYTNPTMGTSTTCYDNGNVAGTQQYSIEISGGGNLNCSLSLKFQ